MKKIKKYSLLLTSLAITVSVPFVISSCNSRSNNNEVDWNLSDEINRLNSENLYPKSKSFPFKTILNMDESNFLSTFVNGDWNANSKFSYFTKFETLEKSNTRLTIRFKINIQDNIDSFL